MITARNALKDLYYKCWRCNSKCLKADVQTMGRKKMCPTCYTNAIPEREMSFRACENCGKLSIPLSSPEHHDLCRQCYQESVRQSVTNGECRECVNCHQMTIPDMEPEWKTMCKSCYLLTRGSSRHRWRRF